MTLLRAVATLLSRMLLVLAATLSALVIAELVVRVMHGYPLVRLQLPARRPLGPEESLRPLAVRLQRADGVDPSWIDESPPPLANRGEPSEEMSALHAEGVARGVLESTLYRQWNSVWVETMGCKSDGVLWTLPGPLLVFDPPTRNPQPIYRQRLSVTTPLGLVTNSFGWRGDDVPVDKPPGTIRLAFVGASTTIGAHWLPFSYPEYVVHWLNLWAKDAGLAVRFDGVNAAREGLGSPSTVAIVRQEVIAMEPDLVVYYEGANQFRFPELIDIPVPTGTILTAVAPDAWADRAYRWKRFSALVRLVDQAIEGAAVGDGREPPKPEYHLRWPEGVDELAPDITRPNLPLQLPTILGDLESIRTALAQFGGELAVSSFVWLVEDGMRVARTNPPLYAMLNKQWWPFRYADIRRMADFQNRVFARYAAAHDLPFVDEAAFVPQDQGLFMDAIHFNRPGTRVQAWGIFNAILPHVRERIASRAWPQADRVPLHEHPNIRPSRRYDGCADFLAQHAGTH